MAAPRDVRATQTPRDAACAVRPPWPIARRRAVDEPPQRPLEAVVADRPLRQRQADRGRRALRRRARRRRRALREPDDPAVVAEVVVAQLRVAVEAELADHGVLEAAGQEIGEEVGPGSSASATTNLLT